MSDNQPYPRIRSGRLASVGIAYERFTKGGSLLRYLDCVCDCGQTKVVLDKHLRSQKIQSCGCLRREKARQQCFKHGGAGTAEWKVWTGMRRRCSDKSDARYKDYGSRGITVCDKWADFAKFLADVGPRPTAKHSIERIDNARGYEPGNVKWATVQEQNNNKRSNIKVEFNGRELSLKEYCKAAGISYQTVQYRRNVLNWPLSRAIEVRNGRK